MKVFLLLCIGLASGVTNSLFGVGGGIIMVPAMTLLLGVDPRKAVATSLAVIIPTSCLSLAQKWKGGQVLWTEALWILPLAFVGSYLGDLLLARLSGVELKRAFGGFMLLVGLRMLLAK